MAGSHHAADPSKQNYVAVCALADKLFSRIREVVASQLVPTTLKVRPAMARWCRPISIVCKVANCIVQVFGAVPMCQACLFSKLRLQSRFLHCRSLSWSLWQHSWDWS